VIGISQAVEAPPISDEDSPRFKLPSIVALTDFLSVPIELPEVLVADLIRKDSVIMFTSGSKSYKTWMLLHLALCVSQGEPWFGRTVTKGRVLFLNFELSPAELQSRLKAIAMTMGLGDDIANFDICNLRGHATDIAKLMPEIIKKCEGKSYAMIIPDPIYCMMGERNENAANEMADFLNHVSVLSERTGAAVIYTHHFAKGNAAKKEPIDRASGSGVFARHADGIVALTPHKEDNAFVVEAELRSFKRPAPFVIRWRYPTMELAGELDPTQLKKRSGRTRMFDVQQILDCLIEEGLTAGEWKAAAKSKHDVSATTFYELRGKVVADRQVEERDKKWFRIPTVVSFKPTAHTENRNEGDAT
jgi:hypothetical protein